MTPPYPHGDHYRLSWRVVVPTLVLCGTLAVDRSMDGYGPATWLGSVMAGVLLLLVIWAATYWKPLRFLYVPVLWVTAAVLLVRLMLERGVGGG